MAELNVNTTVQTGETQEIANVEMKAFYDTELIRNAEPLLVHDKFGQKRSIPKNGGKTIEFRRLNPFPKASKPLSEGVTPDGKKLDWSKQTATVNQYGDYVTVSDMLDLTAVDNNILEAAVILGDQAGRTLDTVTREVINAGTNVQYGEGKVSARHLLASGDCMNVAAVKKAVSTLKKGMAKKINGDYIAIIHPNVAYDLMNDEEWKSVQQYNPDDWYEGEIGKIFGCRFIESSEAKVFTAEPLSSENANLSVASTSQNTVTIKETLSADETEEIIGRAVIIGSNKFTVVSATSNTLTLDASVTASAGEVIYPGEAGKEGKEVYSTLFIGADAYGVTEIEGGGLKLIIKQLGSAGSGDPLDQRATVGWKAAKTAAILSQPFMVRVETSCSISD